MCCAKGGGFTSLLSEILAFLRPHVLGSAGLRPHFFVRRPQKREHTFKTTFLSRE